jgi:hypothetical protein
MEAVFGILLVLIIAVVTWCVASEGAFGAGLTLLCVLFAGLLAMNFFEPVANLLDGIGSWMTAYSDFVALVGLFALFVFLGRLACDCIAPTEIEYDARVYNAARWLLALATGYLTMAILLTAVHTAPLPRNFLGFSPERRNLFDLAAPDRQWLGFTQHVSEKILATGSIFDGPRFPMPETTQQIWPSFPIRYATRRQMLSTPRTPGVMGAPAAQPAPPVPVPGSGAPPPGGGAPVTSGPGIGPPPKGGF